MFLRCVILFFALSSSAVLAQPGGGPGTPLGPPDSPPPIPVGPTCASEYLGTVNGMCQYVTVTVGATSCGDPTGFSQQPIDGSGNCPEPADPPCNCDAMGCVCGMSLISLESAAPTTNTASVAAAIQILDRHISELTALKGNPEVNEVPFAVPASEPIPPGGPTGPGEETPIEAPVVPNGRRQLVDQLANYATAFKEWINNPANGTEAERVAKFKELYVPRLLLADQELRLTGMNLNGRVRLKDGQAQATLGTAGNFEVQNEVAANVFFEDKIVRVTTQVNGAQQVLYFQTYLIDRGDTTAFHGYQIESPANTSGVVNATLQDRHRYAHILRTANGRNFLVTSQTDLGVDFASGL